MKKTVVITFLAALMLLSSCNKEEQTGTAAVPLPPSATENYGTGWAFAGMDGQIPSDDPDFSVTGSGFEYRGGWLGINEGGYFDIACVYEPGCDERFTFEFDVYAKDNGVLWLGFWLYGKDDLPDDGIPGVWIKFGEDGAEYDGKTYKYNAEGPVKIKAKVNNQGFEIYENGAPLFESGQKPLNGGGAIKLYSNKSPVYVSNTAFRLGN